MAYEDLLKDTSASYEDGNYFVVTLTDLDINQSYPLQFKWTYKDKAANTNWSAVRVITTPGESTPGTPELGLTDVVGGAGYIKITWSGKNNAGNTLDNIDRVDIYIDGSPFDGTKPTDNFKTAGTKSIVAPQGDYTVTLEAISKIGGKSAFSLSRTISVTAIGEVIQPPTLPSGLSVTTAPFSVSVNWPGTYSSSTFTGFKSIDIYAVGSDLGTSATSGITSTNLVGSLTVQDIPNKTNIGLDNLRQALSLSTNSDVYSATIFYYYNSVNKSGTKYGSPTYTRINSSSVIPTKANYIDLASGVISIENLVAGSGNFSSWMRIGSSSGGSRIELSSVSDFVNSGNTVQKGMVAYSSGGTEIFNLDTDAGTLSINGSGTFTGDLSAGSGSSIFKVDSNGIYLGNATYSSAPFHVSRSGVLRAESGTIGGWTLGSQYLQNTAGTLQLNSNTSTIYVGATSGNHIRISPTGGIAHYNSGGSTTGNFTLTPNGDLSLSGTFTINASSTIDGTAASTVKSGAATGASALQPNGTLTGNVSGTINNIAVATVTSGAASGASSIQPGNGVSLNSGANTINTIRMNSSGIMINTAASGTRLELSNSGLYLYNGSTATVSLDAATGNAYFKGDITGASGTFSGSLSGATITGGSLTSIGSPTGYAGNTLTISGGQLSSDKVIYLQSDISTGVIDLLASRIELEANTKVTGTFQASGTSTFLGSISVGGYIYNAGYQVSTSGGAAKINDASTPTARLVAASGSSQRFKKNIKDINLSPSIDPKLLLTVPIRSFNYKDSYLDKEDARSGLEIPGFIAEELNAIYPIAVDYDIDGLPQRWNADFIIPGLLSLIQDLNRRLDALEG